MLSAVFPNVKELINNMTKGILNSTLSSVVKEMQVVDPTKPQPPIVLVKPKHTRTEFLPL